MSAILNGIEPESLLAVDLYVRPGIALRVSLKSPLFHEIFSLFSILIHIRIFCLHLLLVYCTKKEVCDARQLSNANMILYQTVAVYLTLLGLFSVPARMKRFLSKHSNGHLTFDTNFR